MLLFQSLNENFEPFDPPLPIPFFCFECINLGLQFLISCIILSVFGHEIILILCCPGILINP
jgi:hypothetical protein